MVPRALPIFQRALPGMAVVADLIEAFTEIGRPGCYIGMDMRDGGKTICSQYDTIVPVANLRQRGGWGDGHIWRSLNSCFA